MKSKPWGGRFRGDTHKLVEDFTASIDYDRRLYAEDIRQNKAYAEMLGRQGIITIKEAREIIRGLQEIEREIESDQFRFDPALEDIHMHIEARLTEKIGAAGRKLHTGRSRNDQVVTDLRLYLRKIIDGLDELLRDLARALVELAAAHCKVIMPGYTHLQRAQPVLFAHHLLAYVEMLTRDRERLNDGRRRMNVMPLGSAALAGAGFPLDREWLCRELGFDAISQNSMDAVSDRDFAVEFAAAAALIMLHLSRLAADYILWSSAEFAFVDLPDAFTTGSSIMPQKKNPDVPELVRGKTSRVLGQLMSLASLVKGLPLTYHRDLQEDKEALFDIVDTTEAALKVMAALTPEIKVNAERMAAAAGESFMNATDLADYLARQGVPFRVAHAVVGKLVRDALERGITLSDLTLAEVQAVKELGKYAPLVKDDFRAALTLAASVAARDLPGGTSPQRVREMIKVYRKKLNPPVKKNK